MAALGKKLRTLEGNLIAFWCPGCEEGHHVSVAPGRWTFDGNIERPTFAPSVLVRGGHYADRAGKGCWCEFYKANPPAPGEKVFKCVRCHSFVRDGQIQFLDDCSHALAGKTVTLPDFP